MKTTNTIRSFSIPFILAIFTFFGHTVWANEGLPYKNVYKGIRLLKPHSIRGIECVPLYVKPIKKIDLGKANFRIVSPDGTVEKLKVKKLNSIPLEELQNEDLDHIEDGFILRIWIPKNITKYAEWFLLHDFEKGSFDLGFTRIFPRKKAIEERRKEHQQKAEQGAAHNT